jgi:hypothetical protein
MRNTLILIGQIRTNERDRWRRSMPSSKPRSSAPVRSFLTALAAHAGVHSADSFRLSGERWRTP